MLSRSHIDFLKTQTLHFTLNTRSSDLLMLTSCNYFKQVLLIYFAFYDLLMLSSCNTYTFYFKQRVFLLLLNRSTNFWLVSWLHWYCDSFILTLILWLAHFDIDTVIKISLCQSFSYRWGPAEKLSLLLLFIQKSKPILTCILATLILWLVHFDIDCHKIGWNTLVISSQ